MPLNAKSTFSKALLWRLLCRSTRIPACPSRLGHTIYWHPSQPIEMLAHMLKMNKNYMATLKRNLFIELIIVTSYFITTPSENA